MQCLLMDTPSTSVALSTGTKHFIAHVLSGKACYVKRSLVVKPIDKNMALDIVAEQLELLGCIRSFSD